MFIGVRGCIQHVYSAIGQGGDEAEILRFVGMSLRQFQCRARDIKGVVTDAFEVRGYLEARSYDAQIVGNRLLLWQ